MVARIVGWWAFAAAVAVMVSRPAVATRPGVTVNKAANPAQLVLTKLRELEKDVREEKSSHGGALETQKEKCAEKVKKFGNDVDMKNVQATEINDGLAAKAATILDLDKQLTKLANDRKTSDEKLRLSKAQLTGVMKNIEVAKASHRAATQQHNSSISSLDAAFGQVQQMIIYMQRAYQTQASANVLNTAEESTAAANATTAEAARSNPDVTNPKDVGVRGAVAATDQEARDSILVAAQSKPPEGNSAAEDAEAKAKLPTQTAGAVSLPSLAPSFKRVMSTLRPEHRSRINPSAEQLLKLVNEFQATHHRRKLLAAASPTTGIATNQHQSMSEQMYKLMRELQEHVRLSRQQEVTSHGKTVDRFGELMEALTTEKGKLEVAVSREEAKNFAGKQKELEEQVAAVTAQRDSLSKRRTGVMQELELLTNNLVEQRNTCTKLEERIANHKATTDSQLSMIKGIDDIISQRVAKTTELLKKSLGDLSDLVPGEAPAL